MNIGQFNIPLQTKIRQTYSVGKYSKTLYEKDSESKTEIKTKGRKGVIITISEKAREFYKKARQVKYQHSSPVERKSDFFKSVFEKVNNDFEYVKFEREPGSKRQRKSKIEFDYEHYLNSEKLGFVVSGNIFTDTDEEKSKSPSEKLQEIFESDQQREPGSLVNVSV